MNSLLDSITDTLRIPSTYTTYKFMQTSKSQNRFGTTALLTLSRGSHDLCGLLLRRHQLLDALALCCHLFAAAPLPIVTDHVTCDDAIYIYGNNPFETPTILGSRPSHEATGRWQLPPGLPCLQREPGFARGGPSPLACLSPAQVMQRWLYRKGQSCLRRSFSGYVLYARSADSWQSRSEPSTCVRPVPWLLYV